MKFHYSEYAQNDLQLREQLRYLTEFPFKSYALTKIHGESTILLMGYKQILLFLNMRYLIFFATLLCLTISCKEKVEAPEIATNKKANNGLAYAEGFTIEVFPTHKVLHVSNPWPGSEKTFKYALVKNKKNFATQYSYDAIIEVPVKNMVVTSTTHIPSLEMLGMETTLVGFPNLDYISSEKTRALISEEKIKELGKNEDLNTEVLLTLEPDVVVGFAVDGNNTTFNTLRQMRIPVMYNGDWTETHPLGKAEWIKFFGALYGKEKEADSIFKSIETTYNEVKHKVASAKTRPTVLSGAMYRDVWYLPQGNSWAAQFIDDANAEYLWEDSEGTGSLSLSIEAVLTKGQNADVWIGPGQFTSLEQMKEMHAAYAGFDAFKNQKVYSFTTKKGATGGVLYYELAPNRPDIVLKDIIKILHPEVLPEHELYFFSPLE